MEADEAAKDALKGCVDRLKEQRNLILGEIGTIQDQIFPDYLNATPDASEKNKIFKAWNPMQLDLVNGLSVLNQGIEAAEKIIKG